MTRASPWPVLVVLLIACHGPLLAQKKPGPPGVFLKDTLLVTVSQWDAHDYDMRLPASHDSLLALIRRERERWRAQAPKSYRFLLNVSCFCPGVKGWQLMEVRDGKLVKAWDRKGKEAKVNDWSALTLDQLFDNLERYVGNSSRVAIGFDPRWHYPTYLRTSMLMPDTWSITEARALKPL